MFPRMMSGEILNTLRHYENTALGWKLSGAGGGGYLILVSKQSIPGSTRIKIRRDGSPG